MIVIDPVWITRLSKTIWLFGLIAFLKVGWGDYWETVKFIYQSIASLLSEKATAPAPHLSATARLVAGKFFGIVVVCAMAHFVLATVSFTMTGSKFIVENYLQRDEDLRVALRKKLEIGAQIESANKSLEILRHSIDELKKSYQNTVWMFDQISGGLETVNKMIQEQIKEKDVSPSVINDGDF